MSTLVDRFVASSDMDKGDAYARGADHRIRGRASVVAGHTVRLLDNPRQQNSRVRAMGIRRQTLYKPTGQSDNKMVGADYNDKPNWSMLLFAAKPHGNHGKNSMLNKCAGNTGQPVHFYAERVNRRFTFQQILKGIVEAIAALVDLLRNGFPILNLIQSHEQHILAERTVTS